MYPWFQYTLHLTHTLHPVFLEKPDRKLEGVNKVSEFWSKYLQNGGCLYICSSLSANKKSLLLKYNDLSRGSMQTLHPAYILSIHFYLRRRDNLSEQWTTCSSPMCLLFGGSTVHPQKTNTHTPDTCHKQASICPTIYHSISSSLFHTSAAAPLSTYVASRCTTNRPLCTKSKLGLTTLNTVCSSAILAFSS